MYDVKQSDISILRQRTKTIYTRIELLNMDFSYANEIQGVISDGNITIDAGSDIRRTFSATIQVKNKSFMISENSFIWLDKKLRVYIGIENVRTRQIQWYPMGIYEFNENSFSYDPTTFELQISCVDLVGKLDGTLAGQLVGMETQVKAGQKIRDVIVQTVKQLGNIKNYSITYQNGEIPYDLSWGTGTSVWEILTELRDLYYSYEMFFDEDTFICQRLPMNSEDSVVLDHNVFDDLVISEGTNNRFSEVKNVIEVWGDCIDADFFSDNVTYSGGVYTVNLTDAEVKSGSRYSFVAPVANAAGAKVKFVNKSSSGTTTTFGPFNLYYSDTDANGNDVAIKANVMKNGKYYVVRFNNQKVYFMGQYQIHAITKFVNQLPSSAQVAKDMADENCDNIGYIVNPESPFTVEKIGRRVYVVPTGECKGIVTDDMAMQRAEYEMYLHARLTDSIHLTTILIPWLDVNKKVEYTARTSVDGKPGQYMIQSISTNFRDGTMEITMNKFYPYYPNTVQLVETSTTTS